RLARARCHVAAYLLSLCAVVGAGSYLWPSLRLALAVSETPVVPSERAKIPETVRDPSHIAPTLEPRWDGVQAPPDEAASSATISAASLTPSIRMIKNRISKGQTLVALFAQAGLDTTQAMALYKAVEGIYNLRYLRVGQPYQIEISPAGQVQSFTYDIHTDRQLHVDRQEQTFVGRIVPLPYDCSERVIVGRIEDSI